MPFLVLPQRTLVMGGSVAKKCTLQLETSEIKNVKAMEMNGKHRSKELEIFEATEKRQKYEAVPNILSYRRILEEF